MAGKIICWIVSFGCAVLFYSIGIYATRLEKPMWFWSGTEVDPSKITDIPEYNRANGNMWKLYSLWYVAAGLAEIWNTYAFMTILILGNTLGLVLLIVTYTKILKKYSVSRQLTSNGTKKHGITREWSHPIFCMKKHHCPHCNEVLAKIFTEETKNTDVSHPGGDGFMAGKIKCIRTAFRCDKCDKTYSIEELLVIERMK